MFNKNQDKFIVTSTTDVLYCNLNKPDNETDLDDELQIGSIENIQYDDINFYILANKKAGKLGFYLFLVNQENPRNEVIKGGKVKENWRQVISWNNKLDIGNCDMSIMYEQEKIHGTEKTREV